MTDPAADVPDHLTIRPPRQERSRRAWDRVLDAGVALLEEAGYEGFTIAAVCERAHVPPRAIYDRAPTKDALFLAVYEHGMARIKADHEIFTDPTPPCSLPSSSASPTERASPPTRSTTRPLPPSSPG
jgi:AcrR family transcriptional regulator